LDSVEDLRGKADENDTILYGYKEPPNLIIRLVPQRGSSAGLSLDEITTYVLMQVIFPADYPFVYVSQLTHGILCFVATNQRQRTYLCWQ